MEQPSDMLSTHLGKPRLKTGTQMDCEDALARKQTHFCHSLFLTSVENKCQDGRSYELTQDTDSDSQSKVKFIILNPAIGCQPPNFLLAS